MTMSTDSVCEVCAIQQLVLREREGRDRQWWEDLEKAYHPDARIRVSWYCGNPAGFIEGSRKKAAQLSRMIGPMNQFVPHQLQPITVRLAGSRAVASLGCTIETQHLLDGVDINLTAYCHLLYRAEQYQGEWKLMSMDCIYERDMITPIMPGTTFKIVDMEMLNSYRKAYRFLSYVTAKMGRLADQDLPGEGK